MEQIMQKILLSLFLASQCCFSAGIYSVFNATDSDLNLTLTNGNGYNIYKLELDPRGGTAGCELFANDDQVILKAHSGLLIKASRNYLDNGLAEVSFASDSCSGMNGSFRLELGDKENIHLNQIMLDQGDSGNDFYKKFNRDENPGLKGFVQRSDVAIVLSTPSR